MSRSPITFGAVGHEIFKHRVVPSDSPLGLRDVGHRDQVGDLGRVDQCQKPVGASRRDDEAPAIRGAQLVADPLVPGR